MYCIRCGADNLEHARFCRKCGFAVETGAPYVTSTPLVPDRTQAPKVVPAGEESQPTMVASEIEGETKPDIIDGPLECVPSDAMVLPAYASLGDRLLAYVADLVVIYLIVFGLYFLSGVLGSFGKPFLSGTDLEGKALFWVALFVYMILSLAISHTTIGKYILGFEVASVGPSNRDYPSFWKIVLRETVGRVFSSFFFGVGYWRVPRDPKGQAWSDEISGTVVRSRAFNPILQRILTSFVVLTLISDVGLTIYGLEVQDRQKHHSEWQHQLSTISSDIGVSREAANELISRKPKDLGEWQADMRQLLPVLEQYDAKLDAYRAALTKGQQDSLIMTEGERSRNLLLDQVANLRKQQNAKLREEANAVTDYDPRISDFNTLQAKLRSLDNDVSDLDHKASEMLATIGIK